MWKGIVPPIEAPGRRARKSARQSPLFFPSGRRFHALTSLPTSVSDFWFAIRVHSFNKAEWTSGASHEGAFEKSDTRRASVTIPRN